MGAESNPRVAQAKARIEFNRFPEQLLGRPNSFRLFRKQKLGCPQMVVVTVPACERLALAEVHRCESESWSDGASYTCRNAILQAEDIIEGSVGFVGP